MGPSERLARLMDAAATRVLSGSESAYEVSMDTLGQCMDLAFEVGEAMGGYVYWGGISDLADAPLGPESLDYCAEVAAEFSRRWLDLSDRSDPAVQRRFFDDWRPRWEQIADGAFR